MVAFFVLNMIKEKTNTKQVDHTLDDVMSHYSIAKEYLDAKITDMNKKDELFRSHLDEKRWPYQSLIFDPRISTAIFEKTSRLLAKKPKGRLAPREGGDTLGAYVSNELLNFQWDDSARVEDMPMVAKWGIMDQNTRKYGVSVGLCKWHYETSVNPKTQKRTQYYDGPNFIPWNNRDVLFDPTCSTVKNWIQLRDYVTLQDLKNVNDTAKTKPIYTNLDLLEKSIKEKGGDSRSSNYQSKNLSISNVPDQTGKDDYFKTVELVTEYRKDRWITFSPKHKVILRDIPNPYDHNQIPVVVLKYYVIDDDIYGLSEIEPVEKLQKAINSLICQYVDAVNMSLYQILKIRSTGVEMHTIEFAPGKKWIMDDPSSDVVAHEQGISGVAEFTSTYRFLVSALQEALGETSEGISNLMPGTAEKTATEVKDIAIQRNARDNYNQIFLSEALKKQMLLWHSMNKQFFFNPGQEHKVIRIVGKEALRYFNKMGGDGYTLSHEAASLLANPHLADLKISPEELQTLSMPVNTSEGVLPKFTPDDSGDGGSLIIERNDLSGTYDYIPDIESMSLPNHSDQINAQRELIQAVSNQFIANELAKIGYSLDLKELLTDYFEKQGIKDADRYFKKATPSEGIDGTNTGPGPIIKGGSLGTGTGATPGMDPGTQTAA